jgi:hypothetical protein
MATTKKYTPKPLTKEQIDDILSGLERPTYCIKSATMVAFDQIKALLRKQLESIELVPEAIPEMKKTIRMQFNRSQIEAHTNVGFLVSEALAQPITQMTLNTFHSSGSSKNVSSGIDALKEIFNGSEERKAYNMNIHFNVCDLNYDDIFELRTKIVEVSLESIISNFEYRPSSAPIPPWTDPYLKITNQTLPDFAWSLRLKLDVDRMLAFKISFPKILAMIADKAPPNIVAVPSPLAVGILDLYPKDDEIDSSLGPNSTLLFLSVSVLTTIQQFKLSGIKGINAIFPASIPLMSVVIEEILYDVEDSRSIYFLKLSQSKMKTSGIQIKDLKRLFRATKGVEFESEMDDGIFVKMPKNVKDTPVKYITQMISSEEAELDKEEKEKRQQGIKGYIAQGSEFLKASKCWFAETNGKNFLEVIKLPEVNPYYSYSNDFYEIASLLGIEAVRNLLILEMKNVLGKDEYINYRHISLLADVMCNLGRLTPISFYGAIRFGQGALSLATNQQSMRVFQNAAAFGKKETTNAVSSSVMLGKEPEGFFNLKYDEKKAKQFLEAKQQPSVQAFENVVDSMYEDLTKGPEPIDIEKTNDEYFDIMLSGPSESQVYKSPKKKREVVEIEALPQVSIATPKIVPPTLAAVAKNIKDVPVFGEDVVETKVVNAPEKTSLSKSIVPRDTTVEDEEEVVLVKKPKAKTATLAPPVAAPAPVSESVAEPVAEPVAAPAKKKSIADVKARLAKLKESKTTTKQKETTKTKEVEESLDVLQNL